jgi:hypothetical protein
MGEDLKNVKATSPSSKKKDSVFASFLSFRTRGRLFKKRGQ